MKNKTSEAGELSLESLSLQYLFPLRNGNSSFFSCVAEGFPVLHVQEKKVHSFCGLLQHAIVCCTDWSLHACISFLWGNAAVLRHNSVLTHLSSCKKATIFRLRVVDWSVLACYSPAFCEVETTLYLHFVTGRKGLPAVGAGVAAVRCAMVPVLPTCNFSVALEDCFSHSLLQG